MINSFMIDLKLEIDEDGTKYWKNKQGQFHHKNGPAIIYLDGEMRWFTNNKHHRIDGPGIVYLTGDKSWYLDDYLY